MNQQNDFQYKVQSQQKYFNKKKIFEQIKINQHINNDKQCQQYQQEQQQKLCNIKENIQNNQSIIIQQQMKNISFIQNNKCPLSFQNYSISTLSLNNNNLQQIQQNSLLQKLSQIYQQYIQSNQFLKISILVVILLWSCYKLYQQINLVDQRLNFQTNRNYNQQNYYNYRYQVNQLLDQFVNNQFNDRKKTIQEQQKQKEKENNLNHDIFQRKVFNEQANSQQKIENQIIWVNLQEEFKPKITSKFHINTYTIQRSQIQSPQLNILSPQEQFKRNKQKKQLLQKQNACIKSRQPLLKQKGSLYDFIFTSQGLHHHSNSKNYTPFPHLNITHNQFKQAIDLMTMNHLINEKFEYNFREKEYQKCETKQENMKRIKGAMKSQYERLNSIYEIDKYFHKQLRFCIVVNTYNTGKNGLYLRNLDSILHQNYTNYHVIYTDDSSTDNNGEKVIQYLRSKDIENFVTNTSKWKIKLNNKKVGMMENIYHSITQDCKKGQIAVMLDGDDSFIGMNVLGLLNAVYQKEKVATLWAQYLMIVENTKAFVGFSHDYFQAQKRFGQFRKLKQWASSHLKTFFVDVFHMINISDFQHQNCLFYGGASDNAMMIPILQLSNPRFKYLSQIVYEYRFDTGQTGNTVNAKAQKEALQKLYNSKEYKRINDFGFIDRSIQNTLQTKQINFVNLEDNNLQHKIYFKAQKVQQNKKQQF